MTQSNLIYTAANAPKGYKAGDREQSFCLFQIHAPANEPLAISLGLEDYRTNVESCVQLAYAIYKERGFHPWTEYKKLLVQL